MAHSMTITARVITTEPREIDLDTLCEPTEVGPESISFIATEPFDDGGCNVFIQCREQATIYGFSHMDGEAEFCGFYRNMDDFQAVSQHFTVWDKTLVRCRADEHQVAEVGTEGNPDLTTEELSVLADEVAKAALNLD